MLALVGLAVGLSLPLVLLFIALCVALGVFGFVSSRRYLGRVRSLREQLDAPSGTDPGHFTSAGFPRPPR